MKAEILMMGPINVKLRLLGENVLTLAKNYRR